VRPARRRSNLQEGEEPVCGQIAVEYHFGVLRRRQVFPPENYVISPRFVLITVTVDTYLEVNLASHLKTFVSPKDSEHASFHMGKSHPPRSRASLRDVFYFKLDVKARIPAIPKLFFS
jgi:hypothetical protein